MIFLPQAAKGSKFGRQRKGQPLSQDGWPGLSILREDSRYADRDSGLCALANAKKNQTKSVSRLRIWTPDRPPAPLFNCRHPAPRRQDPHILAGRHAANSRFPTLLYKVEGRQAQPDDYKAQGEQGEGRQQLADNVKLKRSDTPKKQPNPLAKAIFGVHGFGIPPLYGQLVATAGFLALPIRCFSPDLWDEASNLSH
jgi:hypothetical protein